MGSEQIPKSAIAALGEKPGSEGNHSLFCVVSSLIRCTVHLLLDHLNKQFSGLPCMPLPALLLMSVTLPM